jgi:hypothetical protein
MLEARGEARGRAATLLKVLVQRFGPLFDEVEQRFVLPVWIGSMRGPIGCSRRPLWTTCWPDRLNSLFAAASVSTRVCGRGARLPGGCGGPGSGPARC